MQSSKGIALGQQKPLSPESIAAIRKHLDAKGSARDRALFALSLDTMLRGCDLLKLRVADVCQCDGTVRDAFAVVQGKVSAGQARPVEVYVTGVTRDLVAALITADASGDNKDGSGWVLRLKVRTQRKTWTDVVIQRAELQERGRWQDDSYNVFVLGKEIISREQTSDSRRERH